MAGPDQTTTRGSRQGLCRTVAVQPYRIAASYVTDTKHVLGSVPHADRVANTLSARHRLYIGAKYGPVAVRQPKVMNSHPVLHCRSRNLLGHEQDAGAWIPDVYQLHMESGSPTTCACKVSDQKCVLILARVETASWRKASGGQSTAPRAKWGVHAAAPAVRMALYRWVEVLSFGSGLDHQHLAQAPRACFHGPWADLITRASVFPRS